MDVADVTGHFGKFQFGILFVLLLRAVCAAFLLMTYFVVSFQTDFLCDNEEYESFFRNSTSQCYIDNEQETYSGNREIVCNKWIYDNTSYHTGIVEEWDLVCDKFWLVSLGYMVFTFGNFLVFVPAGQLADKFGRLPLSLIGQGIMTVASIALYFSNSMEMFLAIRFVIGIGFGIVQTPLLCQFLEAIGPRYRDLLVLSFSGMWGIGTMMVAGISYVIPDWRTVVLISSFPMQLPMLFFVWWLVPESTRWLITVGKFEKAEKQLVEQARINGIILEDSSEIMNRLKEKIEQDNSSQTKPNVFDLFRNPKLRGLTTVLFLSFFLTVFIYHGFMVTMGRLGGSLHMNMFLSGLIEIPVVVAYLIIVKYFNRRNSLLINFIASGILFLLTLIIPQDYVWTTISLAMIGRLCNSLAYTLLYVFASELFPTNLRVVAVSVTMSAGRIGSLASPVTDILAHHYGKSIPNAIYGTLSLLTSLIFLLLPTVHNENLPDTVAESEKLTSKGNVGNTQLKSVRERINLPETRSK